MFLFLCILLNCNIVLQKKCLLCFRVCSFPCLEVYLGKCEVSINRLWVNLVLYLEKCWSFSNLHCLNINKRNYQKHVVFNVQLCRLVFFCVCVFVCYGVIVWLAPDAFRWEAWRVLDWFQPRQSQHHLLLLVTWREGTLTFAK